MNIYQVMDEDRGAVINMLPDDVAAEDPVLFCAVTDDAKEGTPVGVLAATLSDNSWNLSYIAVDRDMRRQGIGRALISGLIDMAIGALADGITLEYHVDPETESGADEFFEAMGFSEVLRSNVYSVPILSIGEGLKNSIKKMPNGRYVVLNELPGRLWEGMRRTLRTAGASYNPPAETTAFENVVFIDPGMRQNYDEEVSSVFLTDSGSVGGCILISPKDGGFSIDYLCSMSNDARAIKDLVGIFCTSYQRALRKYGKDSRMFVNIQNVMSERLFMKFAGGKEALYGVAVEREMAF